MMDTLVALLTTECGALSVILFILLVSSNVWWASRDKRTREETAAQNTAFLNIVTETNAAMKDLTVAIAVLTERVR